MSEHDISSRSERSSDERNRGAEKNEFHSVRGSRRSPPRYDDSRYGRSRSRDRRNSGRNDGTRSRSRDSRQGRRERSRDRNEGYREKRDRGTNRQRNDLSATKESDEYHSGRNRNKMSAFDRAKQNSDSSSNQRWGKEEEYNEEDSKPKEPEYKPDFGLSEALAKDERTGNMKNGIVLKYSEPFESAKPTERWRFFVYKGDEIVETLHLHRQNSYLIGRDIRVCDIKCLHESVSLQHAVIQYREISKQIVTDDGERKTIKIVKPYIMDLNSTHGTFLNGKQIENSRYYELRAKDLVKFGVSSREYILLSDDSTEEDSD